MNGILLSLLVDTGSGVSILSEEIFRCHFAAQIGLEAPPRILKEYSGGTIPVSGCFTATVQFKNIQELLLFYVVPSGRSLLGIDATYALRLILAGDQLRCLLANHYSFSELPQAHPEGTTATFHFMQSPGIFQGLRTAIHSGTGPCRELHA